MNIYKNMLVVSYYMTKANIRRSILSSNSLGSNEIFTQFLIKNINLKPRSSNYHERA